MALEQALHAILRFLEDHDIPYMVIGGIANLVWGEPRSTLDIDISVMVEEAEWPSVIREARASFRVLPANPMAFLRDTNVLPVETSEGIRIDLVWANLPYEHKAIARARAEEFAGQKVRVCRPEDLIIHKILSDRAKDREDIRGIARHQRHRLDRRYLRHTVEVISQTLGRSDFWPFIEACLRSSTKR